MKFNLINKGKSQVLNHEQAPAYQLSRRFYKVRITSGLLINL